MEEAPEHPALARIDRALARIETAARARVTEADSLARRHQILRERMAEAIGALDQLIVREGGEG